MGNNTYKAFCNLQTTFPCIREARPSGMSMYTSSSRSPWRKAFFTSNWCSGQSKFAVRKINTLTTFNFSIGEKVDNLSHMSKYIPLQPALLYTFL